MKFSNRGIKNCIFLHATCDVLNALLIDESLVDFKSQIRHFGPLTKITESIKFTTFESLCLIMFMHSTYATKKTCVKIPKFTKTVLVHQNAVNLLSLLY